MRLQPREFEIGEHKLVLRSPEKEDAEMLCSYLARVCGETRFMMQGADECKDLSIEDEERFILSHIEEPDACLIIAELDGQHIGNASFNAVGPSRRNHHRANIGIAIYLDYTCKGIGKTMFQVLLETIETCGFESAELTVIEGNERAKHMYETFGFAEVGRIPKANKYDDGTYADDILMYKDLRT